ncbi:MAG: hypothetical protein KDB01_00220 [Planctomycetaceae bacterium]|nr:hypothetical protein [Planctomycetaceae bacterium]
MKKKRRLLQSDTFWGLSAAILVVLQFWWLPGEDGSASDSYSTTVDGQLGLYRTLSELFPKVERDALRVVPPEPCCLVLTAPDRYPNEREQNELYQFVTDGGTLVFAPNWGHPDCEIPSLHIGTQDRHRKDSTTATSTSSSGTNASGATSLPAEAAEPDSKLQSELEQESKSAAELEMDAIPPNGSAESSDGVKSSDGGKKNDSDGLDSPEDLLAKTPPGLVAPPVLNPSQEQLEDASHAGETVDVVGTLVEGSVQWHTSADLEVPEYLATDTLVTSASGDIEVATWLIGSGRVIACSSADIFSNRSMLYAAPRRLAVRLVELGVRHGDEEFGPETAIVINEYFNASDSYAQTGVLFSPSLRIGTLQLILVAVLGIWLAFYRFGPANEVSTLQRRSLTESAQAVGNLQYRLNDGGAVIRSYLEYIRSELRRRFGSGARLDQPVTVAQRAGMDAEEVRIRLAEAEALAESAQLSPEKTAAALRWLTHLQSRLSGIRD